MNAFITKIKDSDNEGIKTMAIKMKEKYDKYWSNIKQLNIFIFIALVLDPRFKFRDVDVIIDKTFGSDAVKLKKKVLRVLHLMFKAHSPTMLHKETLIRDEEVDEMRVDYVDATSLVDAFFDDDDTVASKSELDIYLNEIRCDKKDSNFDILIWWRLNCSRFPTLVLMARDLLATPVTTVASESAFSLGGRILDAFRSSLNLETVEAIICARDWIQNRTTINLEESLEELEQIEQDEEHKIIDVEIM